jgi:hypothetical protein
MTYVPAIYSSIPRERKENNVQYNQSSKNVSKFARLRLTSLSEHELCSTLVRTDASSSFDEKFESALNCWTSLLKETTINAKTSVDPCITTVLKTLDGLFRAKESSLVKSFAYLRLLQVFDHLEQLITLERRHNLRHDKPGRRNASIAVDIYMSLQEKDVDTILHRRQLAERKRIARRWRMLAGPSPFFLLVYSDAAERIM